MSHHEPVPAERHRGSRYKLIAALGAVLLLAQPALAQAPASADRSADREQITTGVLR